MISKNERRRYHASRAVDDFLNLPKTAQEIIFEFLREYEAKPDIICPMLVNFPLYEIDECESPIEKILAIALALCRFERDGLSNFNYIGQYFHPQVVIDCGERKYRVDFLCDPGGNDDDGIRYASYPVVIECDGHDYHEKTKKQVAYNNQRDYDLKNNGYDILHFSGSQIVNDPFGCANNILDYMEKHTIKLEES